MINRRHHPNFLLRITTLFSLILVSINLTGCVSQQSSTVETKPKTDSVASALFEDVATSAGLNFKHILGGKGKFYFIESTPAGCAFLDYDNDGYQDIFLVQSGSAARPETVRTRPSCALFRNRGNGTFEDVTRGSGLDKDLGYGQGVAIGDYDNDGFDDIFVTAYGGNHLFRNTGKDGFQDVTRSEGLDKLHDTGFATSAVWGDYDNDGKIDLYVCYYSHWNHALDKPCYDDRTKSQDYCSPTRYPAVSHQLYHNTGNGFEDVSKKSGISKVVGRGLAAAFIDYNEDGKQDIFVANDQNPSMLWRNNGNGTFTDVADQMGCAYDGQGQLLAGMGVAVADYNRSGRESLYVSNFANRANILFKNQSKFFSDATQEAGLGFSHLKFLSFGCEFFDYDADGWPDLLTNNGHVQVQANKREAGVPLKMRKQLLHNKGNGAFEEITDPAQLGDLTTPVVGRGLATGDFDNDGRVDVLAMSQDGPVQLFRNRLRNTNHWISLQTSGTKSNRDGIGTRIEIEAGGAKQTATVRGGSSYLSSSDRRVYFGLGKATKIERLTLIWPSGTRQTWRNILPDKFYVVSESKAITARRASPSQAPS